MKDFGKKYELGVLGLSIAGLVIGTILVGMSGSLPYVMEEFLETKVFTVNLSCQSGETQ